MILRSMEKLIQRRVILASTIAFVFAFVMSMFAPTPARCDDFNLQAQRLSDSAFAILNSLNSDGSKANAAEVTSAMASFAGDAQTLSTALSSGDRDGAGAA